MQNFGVTNKEYYGMLWYFLEWSIVGGPFARWHHMTATDNQNPVVFQGSVKAIVVLPCCDHSI